MAGQSGDQIPSYLWAKTVDLYEDQPMSTTLPDQDYAWVRAQLPDATTMRARLDSPSQAKPLPERGPGLVRVVTNEPEHPEERPEVRSGPPPSLPVVDGGLVDSEKQRNLPLQESEVQAALPLVVADRAECHRVRP